jgi:hypothetical protein
MALAGLRLAALAVVVLRAAAWAQVPLGAVAGTVRDFSGAAVPRAAILVVNVDTGLTRELSASDRGDYAAPALPPGSYRVEARATGFRRAEMSIEVQVGATRIADLTMQVGDVSEAITVVAGASRLNRDRHQVDGVVSRVQIESVPLNGRSFLELAKLEPGVTNPLRGTNNRTFVASLNSGLQTPPRVSHARVTMDGASVATIGGPGAALQVSQEAVDEFQMATVNLDVATGFTSNGAINIVTRTGSNRLHGTGFALYRDNQLAAYPGLVKDADNPDPFFRRVQGGLAAGGPIRRDRAFFFASYERTDQDGVVAVRPTAPEFVELGGIFPSVSSGTLLTVRADARLHERHRAFFRYTLDDNHAFAPIGAATPLPSGWSRIMNRVGQSLGALTSTVSNRAVNDARLSVLTLNTPESPAEPDDCPGCFGVGSPRTTVQGAGLTFGRGRTVTSKNWRVQLTDDLSWAIGRHLVRLGVNWEHASSTAALIDRDSATLTLWSPLQVRVANPAIPLPASFATVGDVHRLPLRSFQTSVGTDDALQKGFTGTRVFDVVRLNAGDGWRVSPRWTIHAGLSWLYEPNVLNHDLAKPSLLAPILGLDRLAPPEVRRGGFSPLVGWTWIATPDGRTLVRGGAGRYADGTAWANSVHLLNERRYLMPLGMGRFTVSGANFSCNGQTLDFRQPTPFDGHQLLGVLPGCRAALEAALDQGNRDFSRRNLNRAKEGSNLSDPRFDAPRALHASVGVQREMAFGIVASADVVFKRFSHTFLNGIDYNRFFSAAGPVIPACTPAQRTDDGALCSNGPIYFDATAGRARYRGLLVRVERRASSGAHLLASYAFGSYSGTNGAASTVSTAGVPATAEQSTRVTGFNADDWLENDGPLPTDLRHVFNLAGMTRAPWKLEVSFNISAQSRAPFSVFVLGFDFNRDGTRDDLLPGTRVNQFGRGLGKDDLVRLVEAYNRDVAGRVFATGGTARPLALPASYDFNDNFLSADVRIGRGIGLGAGGRRVHLFVEVFNVFNTRNLVDYGMDISNSTTFGQPAAGFTQVFGSGGPRAAQVGARLRF